MPSGYGDNGELQLSYSDPFGATTSWYVRNGSWVWAAPNRESRPKPQKQFLFESGTARSAYKQSWTDSTVTWKIPYALGGAWTYVDAASGHYGVPGYTADEERLGWQHYEIEAKLREKLRNSCVNLAQALGEYKQTANLFAETAQDVAKLWTGFKRGWLVKVGRNAYAPKPMSSDWLKHYLSIGKSRAAAQQAWSKIFANRWLQYQYGVKPLVADVQGAMKRLTERVDRPMIARVTARKEKRQFGIQVVPSASNPSRVAPAIFETKVERNHETRCVAVLKNELLSSTLGSTGFTNPVSLAWELMPYSFVIDWFVNVGDVLASLDDQVYFDHAWYRPSYRESGSVVGGGMNHYKIFTTRGSCYGLGIPKLEYRPSLSKTKVLSALALLRQAR